MTKLEKIEQDIASLTPGEVAKLARWFAEFHADVWDRQIADDANAGRLDYWSARIGDNHRTLAVESPDGLIWFWIGTHADYDRLIR